ncbi:MAG: hypothetical protein NC339_04870 [Muribaculaceae bacterium]|nr:hypothetical protein [Muribaculaceae bacterium]
MKEFQEKEAIAAMRSSLTDEASARINDDELLNIIDIIWDWYDDQGLLEIDAEADSEDVNVDALVSHVRKTLAKDKLSPVEPAEVEPLVAAELRYEQTLEL